ncbi:MAG TPA: hypothetical protein VES73_04595 [Lamprocystis sp. (in: g-proteobacteria)]|nr:hypothetical protein [Lamprocystis sp. (in: g-proteobacteria)]
MSDLATTLLSGAILLLIAILGIAARMRQVRARRARPTDWARYDVPTVIRRRTSGTDQ